MAMSRPGEPTALSSSTDPDVADVDAGRTSAAWERHVATLPLRRSDYEAMRARRRRRYERIARGWAAGEIPRQWSGPVPFEAEATRVVDVALVLFPALLQSPGYARELFTVDGRGSGELAADLDTRLARQAILTRERGPVEFEAFIDEPVLLRPIGGPVVMVEQLRHVLTMSRLPNVCVRIIPTSAGGRVRLEGGFQALEFPLRSTVVHLEHGRLRGSFDRDEDTAVFTEMIRTLAGSALSPADSATLLARLISELEARF
ncbi:DUF5753 domain-containing protein [Actinoalloteichus hymeniacidonis]|nr:DUF5753 domain-containing protein [Actinoalloteichus hymeniacidonis]MBB5909890.1 hypothetical protein [Actinoalloteichus hymeniacidonis]